MGTKTFFKTADGSLTLSLDEGSEKMHSEAGAFSETAFVYGGALDEIQKRGLPPRFLVLGLGLGYIEMMLASRCLSPELQIVSFEKEAGLRENLIKFLKGRDVSDSSDSVYEDDLGS